MYLFRTKIGQAKIWPKTHSVNHFSQADSNKLSEVCSNFLKLQFGLFLQAKSLSEEVLSKQQGPAKYYPVTIYANVVNSRSVLC